MTFRTQTNTPWTEERVQVIATLWAEGWSASQIAMEMHRRFQLSCSRNAVIGVIHRRGLSIRVAPSNPVTRKTAPARPRQTRPAALRIAGRDSFSKSPLPSDGPRLRRVVIPFREEAPGLCTILTLGPHMCKWPIGRIDDDTLTFCGQRAEEGKSYCGGHHKRSISPYQPAAKPRPYDARGG